jgi:hypothetical protein
MIRLEVDPAANACIMGCLGFRKNGKGSWDSMTAITRIFTPEGFIIAADGCACDDDNRRTSTTERKIFAMENLPAWTYGCGLSDTPAATFTNEAGPDVYMHFKEDFEHTAGLMATMGGFDNVFSYAKGFSDVLKIQIRERVVHAKEQGIISASDCSDFLNLKKALKLQFAGYFKGTPSIITTRIIFATDEKTQFVEPSFEVSKAGYYLYPPSWVARVLVSFDDGDFTGLRPQQIEIAESIVAKYRIPEFKKLVQGDALPLNDAVKVSDAFIKACSDPQAPELDPKCKCIGGRIHVAIVRPNEGFAWMPEREPLPETKNVTPQSLDGKC